MKRRILLSLMLCLSIVSLSACDKDTYSEVESVESATGDAVVDISDDEVTISDIKVTVDDVEYSYKDIAGLDLTDVVYPCKIYYSTGEEVETVGYAVVNTDKNEKEVKYEMVGMVKLIVPYQGE